ncbi:LacI family DNA-binding transcriptional regulator [Alkalibacterium sp. f15]|uniref:LacI family DNA-binding transcriptional regulator n=1 Tax=Alkalibacterium sp. f15 TaxID=3414029 RepID=UPI003BF7CC54
MTTMKDVAVKAGVGLGTVSRVINNAGPVKDSTRRKVERVIKELNYQPNEAARNFKMQQSLSIALIVPTVWHPFYSEFSYYVERELLNNNYKTILCNSQNEVEREIQYITMLQKNKIDGIIAITYSKEIDQYVTSNLPMVSIDRHFTEDVVNITSDHYSGGFLAASELSKRGCKHIGYIGSVSSIKNESMLRRKGFEDYVNNAKVLSSVHEVIEPVKDLSKVIVSFLEENPTVDGLFCMNDKWAIEAISVCKNMNKKVPEDIQIIGFDGAKMSKDASVSHSTIEQPIQKLAKTAAQSLIKLINGKEVERRIILPVKFKAGNSTKSLDIKTELT